MVIRAEERGLGYGGLRDKVSAMAGADRNDIPSGLNRIRTQRDTSEEPSSSGGDDSPARYGFWGDLGRDGLQRPVPRVKAAGDGCRRSGSGKGVFLSTLFLIVS